MARRPQPPQKQPANLTPEEKKAAIPKINRRLSELENFDVDSIDDRSDTRIKTLEGSIDQTLVSIFRPDTLDYDRYRLASLLDTAGLSMMGPIPLSEVRQGLQRGKDRAIALLNQIITSFEEDLDDLGESDAGRALRAIDGLELHPEIERAAGELFRNRHYANAVEDACKALNMLVKLRSGRDDLDGTGLMQTVFSPKNPVLKFNELKDDSDRSEQQGMMYLFTGAMMGLRNPRAHRISQDDPERALEYIAFVSLLAKLLDEARKA